MKISTTLKIKDLKDKHPDIYNRILECQVEAGNEPNDELFLGNLKREGNFNWTDTREGCTYWDRIDDRYPLD